jgi:hypothetical protein
LGVVWRAQPLFEMRMTEAAHLLATAGLAHTRLAQGAGWFIEPWVGDVIGACGICDGGI